jgi:hypothetical protein
MDEQNEVALVLWLDELMAQEFGAYTTEHRARAAGYLAKRLLDSDWLRAHDRRVAAEAWKEGAFYFGGDAAEQWYFNDGGSEHNPYAERDRHRALLRGGG